MLDSVERKPERLTGEVQSLTRGLNILEYVANCDGAVRLRDVAHAFAIDRSVALRFLATLEKGGYVDKDPKAKTYSIGVRFEQLGRDGLRKRLLETATPVLMQLVEQTGQAGHLAILKDGMAVLIEALPSTGVVSVRQASGDREPLHASAVGKALLAFALEEERRELLSRLDYTRLTANTLKDRAALERQLQTIRDVGIAFDEGEGDLQVNCLAAPILTPTGQTVAAIGLSMVAALHPEGPRQKAEWIRLTRDAAETIGRLLAA